jgi:hypothetical protein
MDEITFEELQEERLLIESQMLEIAEDYLFQDDSYELAANRALTAVIAYNYVIRKLKEIGGYY